MPRFAVVIPCYNEEKNIPLIISKFLAFYEDNKDLEVIIVNNGSTDNSQQIITSKLVEVHPNHPFKIVNVMVNQGYGYGILQGLNSTDADFIGWTHADLQTDPQDVIKAIAIIKKNNYDQYIYVKGQRQGRKLFDNFFTIGMSIFESILLKVGLWEINAQPNFFHKSFYQKLTNPPYDFSLDLFFYYQAKKLNLKIIRFVVQFKDRIHGTSKWNNSFKNKIKFIKRTINFSLKLKNNL